MQPIVAPTAWKPDDLRDVASWSYRLTERDRAELVAATEAVKGIALEQVSRANFKLSAMAKVMAHVRRDVSVSQRNGNTHKLVLLADSVSGVT